MSKKKTGLLLLNLGTPSAPTPTAVKRFLKAFLSDPEVIDLPTIPRWLLLNTVILPFRTKNTTEAYRTIWTKNGSPLLLNSLALTQALQNTLGESTAVALGMRYGEPSIESAIQSLLSKKIDHIVLFPLYPQYARSTTESSLLAAKKYIKQCNQALRISIIPPFYNDTGYIDAMTQLIRKKIETKNIERFIFSFHGLPERAIHKVCHEKQNCDLKKPCPSVEDSNQLCYRAHCYESTRRMAEQLNLKNKEYLVTFQSRLGKTPWITPYTDKVLTQLAEQGIRHIAIICPSFLTDCLETLEEIDIRYQAQWKHLGGENFVRIPCLNDDSVWVDKIRLLYCQSLQTDE